MKVTTEGFEEVASLMRDLDLDMQRPILKKALTSAAAPIVFRAKRGAREHKDSGLLADAIGVRITVDRAGRGTANIRPYGGSVAVEQTGPDGVKHQKITRATAYAHLVEFGSKNVSARPYMRPALDGGLSEAIMGFRAEVENAIDKRARKLKRQQKKRLR